MPEMCECVRTERKRLLDRASSRSRRGQIAGFDARSMLQPPQGGKRPPKKCENNHRPRCSLFRVNHCRVATALVWLRLEPRVGHWSSPAHQGRVHSMLTMRSAGTQHAGQRNTGSSTSSGRRRSGAAHGPGQRAGPRAVRRRGVRSVFKRNSACSQGIVAEQNFSKTYGFTFGIRK